MKKKIAVLFLSMFLVAGLFASDSKYDQIDFDKHPRKCQLRHHKKHGNLNAREVHRTRKRSKQLSRTEKRAWEDGYLTRNEYHNLKRLKKNHRRKLRRDRRN